LPQLVDYLSGDFLDEQYKGQKDLAHKISNLGKMLDNYGTLGEFLFDKKLLNGELF
jgi:ferritin heavy chain